MSCLCCLQIPIEFSSSYCIVIQKHTFIRIYEIQFQCVHVHFNHLYVCYSTTKSNWIQQAKKWKATKSLRNFRFEFNSIRKCFVARKIFNVFRKKATVCSCVCVCVCVCVYSPSHFVLNVHLMFFAPALFVYFFHNSIAKCVRLYGKYWSWLDAFEPIFN